MKSDFQTPFVPNGALLINGGPVSASGESMIVESPTDGHVLAYAAGAASDADVALTLQHAEQAQEYFLTNGSSIVGAAMKILANMLPMHRAQIIEHAAMETGLSVESRLGPEFDRMIGQLALFSDLASSIRKDRAIVCEGELRSGMQLADVRSIIVGIGPVLVIEPSNFPFAFGAVGTDVLSALAAGCPVIFKTHPSHPGTGEFLGRLFLDVLMTKKVPGGAYQLLHGSAQTATAVLEDVRLRGVSFTGSREAGQAVLKTVSMRKRPLDAVSLEMGSLNPVFVFPNQVRRTPVEIADALFGSITGGAGQFCTKPGLIFLPVVDKGSDLVSRLVERIKSAPPMCLLSRTTQERFNNNISALITQGKCEVLAHGIKDGSVGYRGTPTLLYTKWSDEQSYETLSSEIFGPATLIVDTPIAEYRNVIGGISGELTLSFYADQADLSAIRPLLGLIALKAGRVIFNGVPTGVRVCDAIHHGGPWPSGYGRYGSVGGMAVERWVRPLCLQNVPEEVWKSLVH